MVRPRWGSGPVGEQHVDFARVLDAHQPLDKQPHIGRARPLRMAIAVWRIARARPSAGAARYSLKTPRACAARFTDLEAGSLSFRRRGRSSRPVTTPSCRSDRRIRRLAASLNRVGVSRVLSCGLVVRVPRARIHDDRRGNRGPCNHQRDGRTGLGVHDREWPGQISWPPPGSFRGRQWAVSTTAAGQIHMSLEEGAGCGY